MKVIVAGHQKTGTKTLNSALSLLGYKVYDFVENFYYLSEEWKQILNTGGSTELFQKMFKDVDAVCDLPSLLFWEEIHKAFPDAKIILTMRENEDVWFESLKRQVDSNVGNVLLRLTVLLSPTFISRFVRPGVKCGVLAYGMEAKLSTPSSQFNEMYCKLCYRRHNAHVLMNAPKDKLLVFDCKEGWDPLCKFLGVDVPEKPFPHKNKGGNIFDELMQSDDVMVRMKREAMVVGSILVALIACGSYFGLKWFNVI